MAVVGIDLGTTNSLISYVNKNGIPEVIPNSIGFRTTPSIISFTPEGEIFVGREAVDNETYYPETTFRSVKRFMGTNHRFNVYEKIYSPEELSAEILKKLKQDAETFLGESIEGAVITVPAYFNNDQRQSTKIAGELAGLKVMRIINEPTAASLSYGLDKSINQTVLVYDLGGGTFDVTILKISDGMDFHVLSTSGDTNLGGDDFDIAIIEMIADKCNINSSDLNTEQYVRIRDAAEKAKKDLTFKDSTRINLHYFHFVDDRPQDIRCIITREEFNEKIAPFVDKTKKCVSSAIFDAGLKFADINEVVFVGGSTRVPFITEEIKKLTGKNPNKTINPDEAVSVGACIQADVLTGKSDKMVFLLDVTPLSLGVEIQGGLMNKMISRNTSIPAKYTEVFTTAYDNQEEVDVKVFQGERPRTEDNILLGEFKLDNLKKQPRGVTKIEVTFELDSDGILSVKAQDETTGNQKDIVLTGQSSLSSDQIKKLLEDSEKFKEEDEEFIYHKNLEYTINDLIMQVEELIRVQKNNDELKDILKSLQEVSDFKNKEFINGLIESVKEDILEISDLIYKKAKSLV